MSGFFVSNSFGHFNSETTTKKFNTEYINWGGPTSQGTFIDMLEGSEPAAMGMRPTHHYKKKGDGTQYMGNPSWAKWSGDKMEFKGRHEYGFHVKGASDASAWYEIEVPSDCALGGTGHMGPSADAHGWSGSILTAANSSQFPSVQKVGEAQNKVRVELTKPEHYISLDPGADVSGIGTFTIKLADKDGNDFLFERNNSSGSKLSRDTVCSATGGTWGTPVYLSMIKWTKWDDGCMETDASNYDALATRESGSCRYNPAPITTFTISKTSVTEGANETLVFDWTLDSSDGKGVSTVKLYANNTDGSDQEIASWGPMVFSQTLNYNTSSLPVGTTTFRLEAVWDRNPGNSDEDTVTLNVSSPQTLINCNDPNASKYGESSLSGDCGTCNSGYYLGTDGLCTNCVAENDDPFRDMDDTTGQCTDCMAGYAEHTDGTCQKVGCMTYADGTSAEDDYNYDPDAVTNDSSLCEGPGDPDLVPETIDCGVSDWSDWSEWSDAATSSGTRTRTRTVVTALSGGGAGCPSLEETETGVVDPNTGTVTTTTTGGDDPAATTPASPSLAAPLIIGGIVLTIGLLVMRR